MPTVPLASDEVVTVGGCAAAAIVTLSAFEPVLLFASLTCAVNDAVPEVVGVPEMVPVVEFSASPVGNAPEMIDQL